MSHADQLRTRPALWRRAISAMLGVPVSDDDPRPEPARATPPVADEASPPPPVPRREGPEPRRLLLQWVAEEAEAKALEQELAAWLEQRAGRASLTPLQGRRDLPWTDLSFLALDTETTGLAPGRDRVIEIAWVRVERGVETARFSSLCSIDGVLPTEVESLTGISGAMLEGARPFAALAPALLEAMAEVDFVTAYHASFDRSFLAAELGRAELRLPDLPWIDPLVFIREVDRYKPGKKLTDASRRWGVRIDRAHRALDDAAATGELLLRVAPFLPARSLDDLIDQQHRWGQRQREEHQHARAARAARAAERPTPRKDPLE